MSKNNKKAIYVPVHAHRAISKWANRQGMNLAQAVERLTTVAIGRLQALETYNKKGKEKVHKDSERRAA